MTPEERARAGAALCEEKIPAWRDEIDPGILNIADSGSCILGQLGGGVMTPGMTRLGLESRLSVPYADFIATLCSLGLMGVSGGTTYTEDCRALTAEWKRLIGR